MSKANGIFSHIEFCPKCGCKSLDRDRFRFEVTGKKKGLDAYPEFVCASCGFGFRITPSYRHNSASTFFKAQRRLRVSVSREEANAQFDEKAQTSSSKGDDVTKLAK